MTVLMIATDRQADDVIDALRRSGVAGKYVEVCADADALALPREEFCKRYLEPAWAAMRQLFGTS